MSALGVLMRSRRSQLGLSAKEVASRAGLHRSYLSLVELGRRTPPVRTAAAIARALEVDEVELLQALLVDDPKAPGVTAEARLARSRHRAARELQRRHSRYTVRAFHYLVDVDDRGRQWTVREQIGCRPRPDGPPIRSLRFRGYPTRGRRGEEGARHSVLRVSEAPEGLRFNLESGIRDGYEVHRIVFPEGWGSASDAAADLSFSVGSWSPRPLSMRSQAASIDEALEPAGEEPGPECEVGVRLRCFAEAVRMSVTLPESLPADSWSFRARPGAVEESLAVADPAAEGICREAHLIQHGERRCEVRIEEPLAAYDYVIAWRPRRGEGGSILESVGGEGD